jgi:hypothetical protein
MLVGVVIAGVMVARRIDVARGSRWPKRLESAGGEKRACRRVRGDKQSTTAPKIPRLQVRFEG